MAAQFVFVVYRHMVKLVDGNEAVVEFLHAKLFDGEAKCCMGANQHFVAALQECAEGIHLATVVASGRITEAPLGFNAPVRPESILRQRLIVETRTDRAFRHDDDDLLEALILELVERDKHERPALTGSGRRFNEKILLSAPFIGAFLHRSHPEGIGLGCTAIPGIRHGNRRNRFHFFCHVLAPVFCFFVVLP